MSSSFVIEPQSRASKKDDTLIIVVNDDGTISVDQETLQSLIMNQSDANVSVVRVGQTDRDTENGDLTLTVDPPPFARIENNPVASDGLVDPFMEMDPEQLEKLETALQSEQAKQILGENVTAMLDMLTVEEQQKSIKYCVELDHCYTSRTSPADPEPSDPLPVAHSPDNEDSKHSASLQSPVEQNTATPVSRLKLSNTPMTRAVSVRGRKIQPTQTPAKPTNTRSAVQLPNKGSTVHVEDENDETSSSSESSSPSDDDSDFGPRGPRRVRARGGRRGLTTRGGGAMRRRSTNKQMDMDQVRRLDMEMAAAVDAMKSPEKPERSELVVRPATKKYRAKLGKKEDEPSPSRVETLPVIEKPPPPPPLQTTNQVKANLINANMIKGDMILTKPGGQARSNQQKVLLMQKRVMIRTNEIRKKPPVIVKPVESVQIPAKVESSSLEEEKKNALSIAAPSVEPTFIPVATPAPAIQEARLAEPEEPQTLTTRVVSPKIKPSVPEVNREKAETKIVEEIPLRPVETKTPDAAKKHVKKEQRKSPGVTLGPALFSTPDIIRRVGSDSASKDPITPIDSTNSIQLSTPLPIKSPIMELPVSQISGQELRSTVEKLVETPIDSSQPLTTSDPMKSETKVPMAEELEPSLEPATNTTKVAPRTGNSSQIVSEQSGIEEHLLATLEMEADKHEEELLAEALLLQEELGVDLGADNATAEPLLSSFEAPDNRSEIAMVTKKPTSEVNLPVPDMSSPETSVVPDMLKKKDTKEPIQIIRGGRVITLPPIEAPATRSKRLKTPTKKMTENADETIVKQMIQPQTPELPIDDKNNLDDDYDDEDDGNSDSEDDPDRLWCICKRPHNNRFMICCDVCEDWFHGKCVHVSKAMGQQMEEKGIEWVCPNCSKKKDQGPMDEAIKEKEEKHEPQQQHQQHSVAPLTPAKVESVVFTSEKKADTSTQCVVCKKEARNASIYCSDACILAHAQETLTRDNKPKVEQGPSDQKSDARVIVFERRTGKVLTGAEAPTTSNLKTWLKEHPTFEVVRPNNLNTLQIAGKTVTAIQTHGLTKTVKPLQGSPQAAKMVYTKVMGSKQTVLAPSKKVVLMSSGVLSPTPTQPKVTKTPIMRQTTIKVQRPIATAPSAATATTPKQAAVKKQETGKASPNSHQQQQTQQKLVQKTLSVKKAEPEPIRLNVRKTLAELLTTRIRDSKDLSLTEEEISELALNIELELYKYFRDTGAKYKAKYRSLVFNIKDTKNLTLFRKIANRSLTPDAVVRLSHEEMASQELAEWREKETKHQLEMIKKNELDLMAQAKSIVVKTHKGELIIENEGAMDHVDPKTPVQDIVSALNNSQESSTEDQVVASTKRPLVEMTSGDVDSIADDRKSSKKDRRDKKDRDRSEKSRSTSEKEKKDDRRRSHGGGHSRRNRERSRDRRSSRSKDSKRDKESSRGSDRHRKSRGSRDHRGSEELSRRRKEEDGEQKKPEIGPKDSDKPIEDRLWRHVEEGSAAVGTAAALDDSDVSDREPSSTVNIKTPDINEESEKEKSAVAPVLSVPAPEVAAAPSQTVWRGFVNMVDVAKFFITAQEVSGHAKDLMEDLPDTVDVVGRISHETVWDYISKMKKTGSKEILVIRLTAANDEEKIPYITLYSYLNSRSRLGVVGNVSKNIKDFYIMPFSRQSQIPPILLPIVGPGFEEQRPHLLLGIIVRNKRKRLSTAPVPAPPPKIVKKEEVEEDEDDSLPKRDENTARQSPSNSPRHTIHKDLETLIQKKAVTQMTLDSLNKAHVGMSRGVGGVIIDNATISKLVPELSSKIDLSDSPKVPIGDDDGDEPYSPGGATDVDESDDISLGKIDLVASTSLISPAKNSTELQRKMDELNRQIEEQKQQIQSISSSFLGDASTSTLPGLGLDPPDDPDMDEAYSPTDSRSFTPPPPIAKFAQPILDKVSDITIPPNLQEILANVKRQENSKVDPYLPSKPSATFLTTNSPTYPTKVVEKYTPSYINKPQIFDNASTTAKETSKSTLRSLSDLDLIKKAEEELAAVAAAAAAAAAAVAPIPAVPAQANAPCPPSFSTPPPLPPPLPPPPVEETAMHDTQIVDGQVQEQPKPPGVEDEDFPVVFPTSVDSSTTPPTTPQKATPKSGVVLSVKRKVSDDGAVPHVKAPRTKSRWGQGPAQE